MEIAGLKVEKRTQQGTRGCNRLRREGKLPGIIYGHKQDPVPVIVEADELNRLIHAGVRMVDIELEGAKERALIRSVQYGAIGDEPIHVDFGRIALDEEIRIDVGLEIHGTPVGLGEGGVLKVGIRQVTIACLPANIPDHIRVEVTGLALGDTLHVRDIVPPEGIRIVTDADAVVAQVRMPAKAAPVAAEAAPEVAEVEAPAGAEAAEEPKAPGKKEKQE